jgi:REP element-mobilizing transposase RayT
MAVPFNSQARTELIRNKGPNPMFDFFDRKADYIVSEGNLPHWYQPGVTYFITFRTSDSIPQGLLRAWHTRRQDWLRRHRIDPANPQWKAQLQEHPDWEQEYHRLFSKEFMAYLDRGYGECVLRQPQLAKLVADTLRHFDGDRYHLGDLVIMPNHVHLLCCFLGGTDLEAQCTSWKQFSGTAIHRTLGRRGRFWQVESFDHLVRGPEAFKQFQTYIADNPKKTRLREGEYLHIPLQAGSDGRI